MDDQGEDQWDTLREETRRFMDDYPAPEISNRELSEACYSVSERGIMDVEFDAEFALRIWKLVEHVRHEGFPKDLIM